MASKRMWPIEENAGNSERPGSERIGLESTMEHRHQDRLVESESPWVGLQ